MSVLQIATRADIGLADAYVDGDFSIVGDKNGLLHFLQVGHQIYIHTDESHYCFTNELLLLVSLHPSVFALIVS